LIETIIIDFGGVGGINTTYPEMNDLFCITYGNNVSITGKNIAYGTPIPTARQLHALFSDGTDLYLYGGRYTSILVTIYLNDVWKFVVSQLSWVQLTVYGAPTAKARFSYYINTTTNIFYTFGGKSANNYYARLASSFLSINIDEVCLFGGRSPNLTNPYADTFCTFNYSLPVPPIIILSTNGSAPTPAPTPATTPAPTHCVPIIQTLSNSCQIATSNNSIYK